jgi:sugar porter (SP) family MFS transporter
MLTAMARFVVLAAAVAALGGSLFGYDTGVISGAILFVRPAFSLSTAQVELVVSAVLIGATIGAIGSARVTDRLGRRVVLLVAAVSFGVGAIGSALAPSVEMLIAARLLVGLAIGVASYAVPLYISELAPPASRGWLVSLNQLAITVGILISYGVDYAFASSDGWRWMLGLAALPALLLFVGAALLPETPRWLVRNGQVDAARRVLLRIRSQAEVEPELADIQSTLRTRPGGWSDLLAPTVRMALVVGLSLAIFQQVTGINTVIYYAPTIVQLAGIPSGVADGVRWGVCDQSRADLLAPDRRNLSLAGAWSGDGCGHDGELGGESPGLADLPHLHRSVRTIANVLAVRHVDGGRVDLRVQAGTRNQGADARGDRSVLARRARADRGYGST